jgi:hypothetical protein
MLTTVKTWSENPGDVTAEGLTIGGIQISYAELAEIRDRQTALDMGVTPDLLELWENQGGHDYSLLVDWLYQYAEETASTRTDIEVTIGAYRTRYDVATARYQVVRVTSNETLATFPTQAEATAHASRLDDLTNPDYHS